MEEDILNYSPTVMFRGTPSKKTIKKEEKKKINSGMEGRRRGKKKHGEKGTRWSLKKEGNEKG